LKSRLAIRWGDLTPDEWVKVGFIALIIVALITTGILIWAALR
jgi:hypothetical protein